MPYKLKKACNHPGCPELVPAGQLYCAKHAKEHNKQASPYKKKERPSPSSRGYGYRWRKARETFLRENPICCVCGKKATRVDHIIPHRGDQQLFWDKSNWQPMCERCHNRKTGRGQ